MHELWTEKEKWTEMIVESLRRNLVTIPDKKEQDSPLITPQKFINAVKSFVNKNKKYQFSVPSAK